jgi:hypothetical protein
MRIFMDCLLLPEALLNNRGYRALLGQSEGKEIYKILKSPGTQVYMRNEVFHTLHSMVSALAGSSFAHEQLAKIESFITPIGMDCPHIIERARQLSLPFEASIDVACAESQDIDILVTSNLSKYTQVETTVQVMMLRDLGSIISLNSTYQQETAMLN